jgi:hypothetical protein
MQAKEEVPVKEEKHGISALLWVAIVLVIGLVVGVALSTNVPSPPSNNPNCTQPGQPQCNNQPTPSTPQYHEVGIILSAVSMALLVALLVVYARTYQATRAPYTLGLVVFLFALLVEDTISSPIVLASFRQGFGDLDPFLAVGQLFLCAALALFLFLSLQ